MQPGQFLGTKNAAMNKAVVSEDYEKAAELRDQINEFTELLKDFRKATKDKDKERSTLVYRQLMEFIDKNT
jgi:excinuclease UvrABC nuclease subunit